MFKVHHDQFQQLADVLVNADYATKSGKQLLIKSELDELELPKKYWLWSFLKSVKPGEIKKIVDSFDTKKRGKVRIFDEPKDSEQQTSSFRSPMHSRKSSCKQSLFPDRLLVHSPSSPNSPLFSSP